MASLHTVIRKHRLKGLPKSYPFWIKIGKTACENYRFLIYICLISAILNFSCRFDRNTHALSAIFQIGLPILERFAAVIGNNIKNNYFAFSGCIHSLEKHYENRICLRQKQQKELS